MGVPRIYPGTPGAPGETSRPRDSTAVPRCFVRDSVPGGETLVNGSKRLANLGVSINGGTPKWLVYNGQSY